MKISLIAALANNNVIGRDGDLPWHLPADMKFFKATTMDHHVILGRKNYFSIPEKYRPLPNRTNIILSRDPSLKIQDCIVTNDLNGALDLAKKNGEKECFIIGGGEIYKLAMHLADKLYLTEIHASIDGDVYFPVVDQAIWKESSRIHHEIDDKHKYAFDFVTYNRY